jgi:peptide-methionine (S)-S-oxide reductase
MLIRMGLSLNIILLVALGGRFSLAQEAGGNDLESAVFAGGCFWCMETAFDPIPGVVETISGYTGGRVKSPTYDAVKLGRTGHYEALKVVYDPSRITYEQLLEVFWRNIDPFNPRGQFCDLGSQYRAAIFVEGDEQRQAAEASLNQVASRTKLKIVTTILPASDFYPAEAYHQNYYQKNPLKYKFYRDQCGRDRRLVEIWGAQAGGH